MHWDFSNIFNGKFDLSRIIESQSRRQICFLILEITIISECCALYWLHRLVPWFRSLQSLNGEEWVSEWMRERRSDTEWACTIRKVIFTFLKGTKPERQRKEGKHILIDVITRRQVFRGSVCYHCWWWQHCYSFRKFCRVICKTRGCIKTTN